MRSLHSRSALAASATLAPTRSRMDARLSAAQRHPSRQDACIPGAIALAAGLVAGLAAALALGPLAGDVAAEEIGYVETFVLSRERAAALQQLIPGTEDYYYYHCLHFQNTEQFDRAEQMLADWLKRHPVTPRLIEIQNRQAFLTYAASPQKTLDLIQRRLSLRFDHQREIIGQKPNLPTQLDELLISRTTLRDRALRVHKNLDGFEPAAHQWLAAEQLTPDQRRHLLSQLQRPDHANLVDLVVADLAYRNSGGFGSLPIHKQLLVRQLDDLLKRTPSLRNEPALVDAYLRKLRPSEDEDEFADPEVRKAHLDRLWAFVQRLGPVHNSLKAHVLYHRLQWDFAAGLHDHERFMSYLQLPRQVRYIRAEFLNAGENRRFAAKLQEPFPATTLPPVGDDEPLVRKILLQRFVNEDQYDAYRPYVDNEFLKQLFAEAKIVNGLGESEQWSSLLTPAQFQALKDRVDLEFDATNESFIATDAPVALDVHVKNVRTLIVKIFKMNTANYYREHLAEVNTDIELDGLVPNHERVLAFDEAPLLRQRRRFEFPELRAPGVYVIDFIGNGKSSRAVIRKGELRHHSRTTAAGQALTIFNTAGQQIKEATVWLGGKLYQPDDAGEVLIPYSNQPGLTPAVVEHGGESYLIQLDHQAEQYSLDAGLYVDRESLLQRQTGKLLIRAAVRLNGIDAPLQVLENPTLTIVSTDHDNVSTSKQIDGLELKENREAAIEFNTPPRLAKIEFTLQGSVKVMSQGGKPLELRVSEIYSVNEMERTERIEDLHLVWADGQYALDLLGRTGEPAPDRAVSVELKHLDFTDVVQVSLQTDNRGRVQLGALPDIAWIRGAAADSQQHTWNLQGDDAVYPASIHGRANESVLLPFLGNPERLRDELSLLEVRGGVYVADHFPALAVQQGILQLNGLPGGDYVLLFKRRQTSIRVRIADGPRHEELVLGRTRDLERRRVTPLQIERIERKDKTLDIQIRHGRADARVHLIATRFVPAFSIYSALSRVRDAEPHVARVARRRCLFVEERNIGDEYRYILERQHAQKFPGNMLERPSMLLNPWALRSTETTTQDVADGDLFQPAALDPQGAGGRNAAKHSGAVGNLDFALLDFLPAGALVLENLIPDDEGRIAVPLEQLQHRQHIQVVAVDSQSTVRRQVSLPESGVEFRDLRLSAGLPRDRHFAQLKQVSILQKGDRLTLADIGSAKLETYDSLGRVYSLYSTLVGDSRMDQFRFVLDWPKLQPAEKREKYSKFACHELNFFLFHKDPEFFAAVVQPYLRHKFHPTFLDEFLTDAELTAFASPWRHARLNTLERLLLGARLKSSPPSTRQLRELLELLPPDMQREDMLFGAALQGAALDTADGLGLREEVERLADLVNQNGDGNAVRALQDQRESLHRPLAGVAGPGSGRMLGSGQAAATQESAPARPSDKSADAERDADSKGNKNRGLSLAYEAAKEAEIALGKRRLREFSKRKQLEQLYEKLDRTQEWAENNYYQLPLEAQTAELVSVNAFWRDYAEHVERHGPGPAGPAFLSPHFPAASRTFSEALLALAVLDLPFDGQKHTSAFQGAQMELTAGSPLIAFHEEVLPTEAAGESPIMASQNYFRQGDRYRYEGAERLDKFVTDEFLAHTAYGCQVVVTNPTSSPQRLKLLLQIPQGSLPVAGAHQTQAVPLHLQPYSTHTQEYLFYFPAVGDFPHFPVHVSKDSVLLLSARPATLKVVEKLSRVDRDSWAYVSQNGTEDDVLNYLQANNLQRTELAKLAFRMQSPDFFEKVLKLLSERLTYDHTLWSYSVRHNIPARCREFLEHAEPLVQQSGDYLDSPLLRIQPVIRNAYQHLDYRPLVNARAHQLGARRQILNGRLLEQYRRLLKILAYRGQMTDDDRMTLTYYLLLQDRVAEALEQFEAVNPERLASRLQHDYFQCYLAFYTGELQAARDISERYADYPVDRWREAFASVRSQLEELEGKPGGVIDDESREQRQAQLAASQPGFEFKVESKRVRIDSQNLDSIQVNYYLMDIELLFSRSPFVRQYGRQFAQILPNLTETHKAPEDAAKDNAAKDNAPKDNAAKDNAPEANAPEANAPDANAPKNSRGWQFDLPESLHNRNVLVEITAAGLTKSAPYYSNSMAVQLVENFGQLRVADEQRRAIPKVYVKVYAQMKDGDVRFFKDGYTDLRGRFDYTSLNTNELDGVEKFSILVLSEQHGAVVREARAPQR